MVGLLPIAGILLYYIPLNGRRWLYGSLGSITALSIFFYFVARRTDIMYPPNLLFITYGGFLMVYLCFDSWMNNYKEFNKTLSMGLLLTYFSTEFWEIPVFVFALFGLFGKEYLGPWNQVYLFVVFYYLMHYSEIKPSKKLLIPIGISALILMAYPEVIYSNSIWFVNRFIGYFFLLLEFLPNLPHRLFILAKDKLRKKGLTLDVGCGRCESKATVGIDISIEACKQRVGDPYVLASCVALPFREKIFDNAYCYCLFHHLNKFDWKKTIEQMLQVGKSIIIFEHNPHNPITQYMVKYCPMDKKVSLIEPWELGKLFSRYEWKHILFGGQYMLKGWME